MRLRTKQTVATAAVVALAGAALLALPWNATAAPTPPAELPDDASAFHAAAQFHSRVEVASRRSETSRTFANPDGTTTVEESAVPVRVRKADGSWVPVDLTLKRNPDGTVSPAAAPVATTLSGGGGGPLGTVRVGADHFSMSWPGALPAPALSGDTATYAEVLPGVDLRVRVDRDGFSEVLVVKTREAARNPKLAQLRFPTSGTRPANGDLFHVGAPMMWDAAAPGPLAADGTATDGTEATSDADRPGRAAKRAPMAMKVSATELVVTPDASLLSSGTPPLYIDPSVSAGRAHWTMINSTFPNQSYWSYDRNGHLKVGFTNDPQNMVYRSLFDFDTAQWRGKHVLGATFSADLIHSWSCTNSTTELHLTNGINSGTTWNNNAGSWGGSLADISNSSCSDVRKYTEWGGGGVTNVVQQSTGWTGITLGLRASNEGSTSGWKKFDENTPKLNVTFNSYPNPPDQLTIDGKPCGSGANKAWVSTVGGHNPVVRTHVTDPDPADHLNVYFAWTTRTGTDNGGSQMNVANGGYAQLTAPATDFDPGVTYAWRTQDNDGTDVSALVGGCEFVVDNTAPNVPPTVTSADGRYPADDGTAGWHDGVGKAGTFTLGAGAVNDNGVNDVASYLYGLVDPPSSAVPASSLGGTATVSVTPTAPGLNTLYVRSVDRVGNLSPIAQYRFFVASGTAPVGLWALNEGSGTTAADTGTGNHPLTLTSGAGWTGGRLVGGNAATFNGSTGSASTSGPVVNSTGNYSVSAWVRLTNNTGWHAAVSAGGVHSSAFYLQYSAGTNTWDFELPNADIDGPTAVRSSGPAQLGAWTHLVGVYDASTRTARIYVNGVPGPAVPVPSTFAATGPLAVGRVRFNSNDNWNPFAGDIGDVRVWDRVVTGAEVAAMVAATPVASWDFDEVSGTTAFDSTPYQRNATLTSGASWSTTGGHRGDDPGALSLGGVSAAFVTGPILRTDQSFSVAAWVKLADTNGYHTVLSQDGTYASAFHLQYSKGGVDRWVLVCPSSDSLSPAAFPMATSLAPPTLNVWVHLVGVYDASARQLRLYVNGNLEGTANNVTIWSATGNFNVGRGSGSSYLPGQIDDVRVYAGVLSAGEISALYNS
jgi:hypothetical protein